MPLSDIVGQDKARRALLDAISSNRVAHAYLFHGPKGVGKETTAVAFAQALNCSSGGPDACGNCSSCRRIKQMVHPDVKLVFPVPSGTPEEKLTVYLKERKESNPEKRMDFRTPSIISIHQIRRIISDCLSVAHEGNVKVFIIAEAERMNDEAANAFLKTLEEPEGRSVFILTTSDRSLIKETILSRCQLVRFRRLSLAEIERVLEEHEVEDKEKRRLLARLADGSAARALALLSDEQILEERAQAIALLREEDPFQSESFSKWTAKFESQGRESRKAVLEFMLSWLRDILVVSQGGSPDLVVNVDFIEDIESEAGSWDFDRLVFLIQLLEKARESVDRNVDPAYILGHILAGVEHSKSSPAWSQPEGSK